MAGGPASGRRYAAGTSPPHHLARAGDHGDAVCDGRGRSRRRRQQLRPLSRRRSTRLPKVGGLLDPDVERILVAQAGSGDRLRHADRSEAPARTREGADVSATCTAACPTSPRRCERSARGSARRQRRTPRRRGSSSSSRRSRQRVAGRPAEDAARLRTRAGHAAARHAPAAATGSCTTCSSSPAAPTSSATCSQQSVDLSTEMILTRAPDVIIELHYGDVAEAGTHRRRSGRSGTRCRRCRRSGTSASTCSTATSSSSPGRASSLPPSVSRARSIPRRFSEQDSGFVVEREGQRVDGARAAPARGRPARRPVDDDQRGGAARGDARGARRRAGGAGGGARLAALADSDPVAVSKRGLRTRDGGSRGAGGRRRVHARGVRRSVPRGRPPLPRGAARGHRADAAVSAVRRRHRAAGARDDRRRPARAHHLPEPEGARSVASPAASSMRSCSPSCRARSIRAASAASSTPAPTTARCSAGRCRSTPASPSSATASSSPT